MTPARRRVFRAFDLTQDHTRGLSESGLDHAIAAVDGTDRRRVVVMFMDGRDPSSSPTGSIADETYSRSAAQTVLALVQRTEQADIGLNVISFDDTMVTEEFLRAVSHAGASASLVARHADAPTTAREFVEELHREYLLGLVPSFADGRHHKIEVGVNRRDAKARSRTSYFAPAR